MSAKGLWLKKHLFISIVRCSPNHGYIQAWNRTGESAGELITSPVSVYVSTAAVSGSSDTKTATITG